ncbi:MAG: glucose/quinate/shikimate family membrane-bound PQQ-dependent dehydrogenase [Parvibaculum sp.]|uniref:glucose/quinate/shikimate family membrane-bound PQQ-dependent dehydrogenase n=1 Tax=Parvibaculum sp. TaxID=2024848 RepID=UPI0025D07AFF|nr:glucose/quinate/shikimate family membrane-bound PQQ-dependent dehydrogenase [Parvibaculum sp.]MCE9650509.1 glucose/quinate/shikimate family membrane-bound PQQ-dependent dehydrogenase [Parvibaculum sp.]
MAISNSSATGRILALIFILAGLALGGGGIWLALLGGSLFYIIIGLAFIGTGILLLSASAWALWLHAATVLVSLAWALWEVGLDWWALAPRGDVTVMMGILLALPWVVRSLTLPDISKRNSGWMALCASLVLSIAVGLFAMTKSPHDISGTLPERTAAVADDGVPPGEWPAYGRTYAGDRYSPLNQITPQNVKQLKTAWTFHTGDIRGPSDPVESTYEVTPLKVGDSLYLCTPHNLVIALDAESGTEKWRFDPHIKVHRQNMQHLTCRGVTYYNGAASESASSDCTQRLFLPTVEGKLIALSAATGKICPGFGGADGTVDLWQNMPNVNPGSYYSTSPPVIAGKLIIVGGTVNDNYTAHETSGVIRAYDVDTGALVWNWDSGNPEATAPIAAGKTYTPNSPNSWSISSYDPKLGLIYIPMGNQQPDQLGKNRSKNVETYSSSIVALHADTGKVAWVFQGTHHDLWDMDIPAQPSLVDLSIGGSTVPALVAPTKQGEIFVLDRRTGKPALPVTEKAAPTGAEDGDFTAPTQPHSALSFNPPKLTEAQMWGVTPFDQLACRIEFHKLRYEGRYTPPSTQGTIVYPGNFGTFNWGGVAVDPARQIFFAMPVYLAFTPTLIPRTDDHTRLVSKPQDPPINENFGSPYAANLKPFLSPIGFPCQTPPWGYVAGADLTTGKIHYRHVNGTVRDLSPVPLPLKMGVPGIGGPLLTGGGVAFLSATLDYYVRAYDVTTGATLWEQRLPAGGQATPMTYWSKASNRQFVIVVAGGHGSTGTKAGDSIIAYALPKS